MLRVERLHIARAAVSLADFTPSTPFKRLVGPLDITLDHFRTDPDNKNPYSFSGVTDGGEKISWSGYFYLDPLRSAGEFALENISLNKYAPLYQDFVRFQIRDGVVDLHTSYHFELSATNRVAVATNASFALHSFKLAEPGSATNFLELPEFAVTGASGDALARHGEIASVSSSGGKLFLRRDKNAAINVVELSKPAETATNAPGGILLLLRSVTNVVAQLLDSTNAWTGVIHEVSLQDSALALTDLVNSRPATLALDHIPLTASNISNVPGAGLTSTLALRRNTNGVIRTDVSASLQPLTADIQLALDLVELRPLDPYLESRFNLFILDGKLGLNGHVHLRTPKNELPQITFTGDAWLKDFATVDGDFGEDLVKWSSVRVSGIAANLNPQSVAIKEITVADAYARLIIETNRTINLLAALRPRGHQCSSRSANRKSGKRESENQEKVRDSSRRRLRQWRENQCAAENFHREHCHLQRADSFHRPLDEPGRESFHPARRRHDCRTFHRGASTRRHQHPRQGGQRRPGRNHRHHPSVRRPFDQHRHRHRAGYGSHADQSVLGKIRRRRKQI